jgi:MbtH protein
MTDIDDPDEANYVVVLNAEGQYSIWAGGRSIPAGWRADGTEGTKAECLAHIADVWIDLRPLSVRR